MAQAIQGRQAELRASIGLDKRGNFPSRLFNDNNDFYEEKLYLIPIVFPSSLRVTRSRHFRNCC